MKRKKYVLLKVNEDNIFPDGMIDGNDYMSPTKKDLINALKKRQKGGDKK